ncbi:MAG TPA: AIR synthase-related protein, partial [Candidatus Methanoperedens sp.]
AALMALDKKKEMDDNILKALFEPSPRVNEGMALVESRSVTSMMDISDGLALSLHDMSRAGNVGFKIYEERLPVQPGVRKLLKGSELQRAAIFSGGDFELLFTVAPDKLAEAKKVCRFTVIGEVTEDAVLIERGGRLEEIEAQGYEHFKKLG